MRKNFEINDKRKYQLTNDLYLCIYKKKFFLSQADFFISETKSTQTERIIIARAESALVNYARHGTRNKKVNKLENLIKLK